jgi:hypothetical protein
MQIENRFIGQISSCHPFWKHLSNGKYGFQCPYCRWGRKPSDRTAYLMPRRRSPTSKAVEWWFRCNHCNHSTTFEKFLEAHHPLEHPLTCWSVTSRAPQAKAPTAPTLTSRDCWSRHRCVTVKAVKRPHQCPQRRNQQRESSAYRAPARKTKRGGAGTSIAITALRPMPSGTGSALDPTKPDRATVTRDCYRMLTRV